MSLVDAIPSTIKEIGAAKASGVAAPGAYGVLLGDVGHMISTIPAQMQQQRSQALREQMASLEVQKAQREAAADKALQGIISNPDLWAADGSLNTQVIASHPGITPEALTGLNRMAESNIGLRRAGEQYTQEKIKTGKDQDDDLGLLALSASKAPQPEDQAGILSTGIAASVKAGRIKQEDAKAILADFIDPTSGNPNPQAVGPVLNRLITKSDSARKAQETEASAAYLGEQRGATADLRRQQSATAAEAADERAQRNYASQLASATTVQRYATILAGIPDKFKASFPSADEWKLKSTPSQVLESVMTPAERETARKDREAAQERADTLKVAQGHLAVDQAREKREAGKMPAERASADQKAYKDFSTEYDRARREERQRTTTTDEATGNKVYPPYAPVPAIEKWAVMTPQERQAVLSNPNARIDDAEMARRSGSPLPSGVSTPSPTSAASPAAPAPARTLNPAELAVFARTLGASLGREVSIEEAKQKAAAAKIQIVP